jgi:hypothetical protein
MLLATNDGTIWRAIQGGGERYYALVVEVTVVRSVKAGPNLHGTTNIDRLAAGLKK